MRRCAPGGQSLKVPTTETSPLGWSWGRVKVSLISPVLATRLRRITCAPCGWRDIWDGVARDSLASKRHDCHAATVRGGVTMSETNTLLEQATTAFAAQVHSVK